MNKFIQENCVVFLIIIVGIVALGFHIMIDIAQHCG